MDVQTLQALLNAGGMAALAGVMVVLHLYNVRVFIPQMQGEFHAELQRERETWLAELRQVRENTERRHQDLLRRIDEGKVCRWERERHAD